MSPSRWMVVYYALLCSAQFGVLHFGWPGEDPDGVFVFCSALIVVGLGQGWIFMWLIAFAFALIVAGGLPLGIWGTPGAWGIVFCLLSAVQLVVLLRRPLRVRCWSRARVLPA